MHASRGSGEDRKRGRAGVSRRDGGGQAPLTLAAWSLLGLGLLPGSGVAQWVEEPGRGWIDVTAYHLDTRKAFGIDGDEREFVLDGHAVSTSVFLTLAAGLASGVDAWVQVPYHRLRFEDLAGDRLRQGIGDTRIYLRAAPLKWLGMDVPFAVRGGVKLPVGDFAVDSEVIPLGDGQTDWELIAELGHSFHPTPIFLSGWAGFRWRQRNDVSLTDFGDELFFLAQVGATLRGFGIQVIAEGWEGATPVIEGVPVPAAERAMLQITPTISYPAGPGQVKAGARISLAGKNLPAGTALVAGYFTDWAF